MIVLLEFVVWLFVLPYILFGLVLRHMVDMLTSMFQLHTLFAGVWVAAGGLMLMPYAAPDDLPFESIPQILARSHVLAISTPIAMIAVGFLLVVVAFIIRQTHKPSAS